METLPAGEKIIAAVLNRVDLDRNGTVTRATTATTTRTLTAAAAGVSRPESGRQRARAGSEFALIGRAAGVAAHRVRRYDSARTAIPYSITCLVAACLLGVRWRGTLDIALVLVAAAVQLQMIPLLHGQVSWWSPHRSEVARALELGPTITTHFVPTFDRSAVHAMGAGGAGRSDRVLLDRAGAVRSRRRAADRTGRWPELKARCKRGRLLDGKGREIRFL